MRGRPQSAPGLETWSHPGETAAVTSWGRHVAVMSEGDTRWPHPWGRNTRATTQREKNNLSRQRTTQEAGWKGNRLLLQTVGRVCTDRSLMLNTRMLTSTPGHTRQPFVSLASPSVSSSVIQFLLKAPVQMLLQVDIWIIPIKIWQTHIDNI